MISTSIFLYIAYLNLVIKMEWDGWIWGSFHPKSQYMYISVSVIPAIKHISIKYSQYL